MCLKFRNDNALQGGYFLLGNRTGSHFPLDDYLDRVGNRSYSNDVGGKPAEGISRPES